jgi:hypothetical protein
VQVVQQLRSLIARATLCAAFLVVITIAAVVAGYVVLQGQRAAEAAHVRVPSPAITVPLHVEDEGLAAPRPIPNRPRPTLTGELIASAVPLSVSEAPEADARSASIELAIGDSDRFPAMGMPVRLYLRELEEAAAVPLTTPVPVVDVAADVPGPEAVTPALQPGDQVQVSVSFYYCEAGDGGYPVGDGGLFCGAMRNGVVVHSGAAACAYIYLGQRFRILGDPTERIYECEDTGSAVHGLHRDIWFQTSGEGWVWPYAVGR